MFFAMIIDMMGWDPASRYRVIGKMIRHKDEYLFVFELASGQEFKREIVVDTEGNGSQFGICVPRSIGG